MFFDLLPTYAFWLSQILAGCAFFLDLIIFQFKDRRAILLCFLVSGILSLLHFFLLGAATAAWISVLFCLRISAAYFSSRKEIALTFIGLGAGVTALTWTGWISLLAFVGNATGTVATFQKSGLRMRLLFLAASAFWLVHNLAIWTPVAAAQEICFSTGNLIGLWRYYYKQRAPAPL